MTLKQVRLATIKEVQVNVSDKSVADAAAGKDNKGNQTGEDDNADSAGDATNNTSEDSQDDLNQYYIDNIGEIITGLGKSVIGG